MKVKPLIRKKVESSKSRAASTHQPFNSSIISIANRQRTKRIDSRVLKQMITALFEELGIQEAEIGINLVGAPEMARVNRQFLKHEGSTDVITFDYGEKAARASRLRRPSLTGKNHRRDACAALHGELFICVDEAVLQAKQFNTKWQLEIVRYLVHGILHLLGHDDLKMNSRRKMKREENRLVRLLAKRFSFAQRSSAARLGV